MKASAREGEENVKYSSTDDRYINAQHNINIMHVSLLHER
jgi:hypothetical protein